jgi:hypothetical protein
VRNYSATARTYSISNNWRTQPTANGVTLSFPSTLAVPANGSANFTLTLTVNAAALPDWTADGGVDGNNGELLTAAEYDGNLFFTNGPENVHIPWHILPHKAANGMVSSTSAALNGHPITINLLNTGGATRAFVDTFSLTGTGVQFPASSLPAPGSDQAVVNLRAVGARLICANNQCSAFAAQFAINTFGQRSHPDVPAEFDIYLDIDNDGTPDLILFNTDIGMALTGTANSGQNGLFIFDVAAGTASGPYAYSIAELDSANIVYTIPLANLVTHGGKSLTLSTSFTFSVLAFDNYFTGNLTDQIVNMRYELDDPKFFTDTTEYLAAPNGSAPVTIFPNNATSPFFNPGGYKGHSPSQTGILVFYSNGKVNQEADLITVTP